MRFVIFMLAVVAVAGNTTRCVAAPQADQVAQPRFAIAIAVARDGLAAGSGIRIVISLTNTSGHDIILHSHTKSAEMGEMSYRIYVRDDAARFRRRRSTDIGIEPMNRRLARRS